MRLFLNFFQHCVMLLLEVELSFWFLVQSFITLVCTAKNFSFIVCPSFPTFWGDKRHKREKLKSTADCLLMTIFWCKLYFPNNSEIFQLFTKEFLHFPLQLFFLCPLSLGSQVLLTNERINGPSPWSCDRVTRNFKFSSALQTCQCV